MSKFVLVEAISQFRMRYVIEVPLNHNDGQYPCSAADWACDTVACGDAKEFSQEHMGEMVISAHEITRDHIITLCDEDNSYVKDWSTEKKFETFVTPIGYKEEK